jgi:hypothetical protein
MPQRAGDAPKPLIQLSEIRENFRLDQQAARRRVGDEIRVRDFREQPARELVDRSITPVIQPGETVVPRPRQPRKCEPDHRVVIDRLEQDP